MCREYLEVIRDTNKAMLESACMKDIRCMAFEYSVSQSKGRLCRDRRIGEGDSMWPPLSEDSIACTVEHGKLISRDHISKHL